jgi:ABC-2 type transport system permease protein
VGTVFAVGVVTLAQLAVLTVPLAVAVSLTDAVGLPTTTAGDLVLAIVWFLLGFALYAFVFAATAATVDKVTEVSSAIMPVTMVLLVGYLVGVLVVAGDPDGPAAVVASIFPLTAPLAMPIRWATGEVPPWQLVAAMALTAATAVALASLSSTVYRRALVVTGRRVRPTELLGGR